MALSEELKYLDIIVRREKASPEILRYEYDLVGNTVEMIDMQQEALDTPAVTSDEKFASTLYQLDLDRVKYLLSLYLRTRLFKIQEYIWYIVDSDLADLLSENEADYARKYYLLKTNHFKMRFLKNLPGAVGHLLDSGPNQLSPVVKPDLDRYVFVSVLDDLGRIGITDRVSVQMDKGGIHLIPYSVAKPLMEAEKLELL